MDIIVLGSSGQSGKILSNKLKQKKKYNIFKISRKDFDLNNSNKLVNIINKYKPNIIINCAAFTNVDQAEKEKENCYRINTKFIKTLSKICIKNNSILIHYSTDYVFKGNKGNYKENDKTDPINYYGHTKNLGEKIIVKTLKNYLIIRVSWLYSNNKNSFYSKIINKIKLRQKIEVIDDQYGFPTSAIDLSNLTIKLINKMKKLKHFKFGIYHYSNFASKPISWYEFALKISHFYVKFKKTRIELSSVSSKKFDTIAKRPKNSSLNIDKISNTFNIKKRRWDLELKKIMLEDFRK